LILPVTLLRQGLFVIYPSPLRGEHKNFVLDPNKESDWFTTGKVGQTASLPTILIKLVKGFSYVSRRV